MSSFRGLHYPYRTVYCRLHVPSGGIWECEMETVSRHSALELVSAWTRQNPQTWVYWLKDSTTNNHPHRLISTSEREVS
jgi:hypothetical protein